MLAEHSPEQQWAELLQPEPEGRHVAACAGVGATIEVTNGTATTAASPSVLTICRRFIPCSIPAGRFDSFFSRWSLVNCASANQTARSLIGFRVLSPPYG